MTTSILLYPSRKWLKQSPKHQHGREFPAEQLRMLVRGCALTRRDKTVNTWEVDRGQTWQATFPSVSGRKPDPVGPVRTQSKAP